MTYKEKKALVRAYCDLMNLIKRAKKSGIN
jgi:hypothetical protein